MKKFWKNNSYFTISMYALFVIVVSILFYRVSSNTDNIAPSILNFFRGITQVLAPIFYGLLIAYLFNPIMDFFERYLLIWFKPKQKRQRVAIRTISILAVYFCVISTVFFMFRYLIPQLLENLQELFNMLPEYMRELNETLLKLQALITDNMQTLTYQPDLTKIFEMINPEKLLDFSALNNFAGSIMNHAVSIAGTLFNWIMGLVIAFYVLGQKETFAFSAKRVTYSICSRSWADKIIAVFSEGHDIFIKFFVGKFIDSFIIGSIAFVVLSIMNNPYALLLALIIGVFNMIPYFGPILGAIPAVAISLFEGFGPAMGVLVFVIILQQFDGLVLGPKILGDSIGLSPFWIISGIIVGGALWGPLGMFFASPLIAVILNNINRSMDRNLEKKSIVVHETYKPIPDRPPTPLPKKWHSKKK